MGAVRRQLCVIALIGEYLLGYVLTPTVSLFKPAAASHSAILPPALIKLAHSSACPQATLRSLTSAGSR